MRVYPPDSTLAGAELDRPRLADMLREQGYEIVSSRGSEHTIARLDTVYVSQIAAAMGEPGPSNRAERRARARQHRR